MVPIRKILLWLLTNSAGSSHLASPFADRSKASVVSYETQTVRDGGFPIPTLTWKWLLTLLSSNRTEPSTFTPACRQPNSPRSKVPRFTELVNTVSSALADDGVWSATPVVMSSCWLTSTSVACGDTVSTTEPSLVDVRERTTPTRPDG